MRQVNVVGPGPLSQPSRVIQTLQAPPDVAPGSVTVRTASETSLWLRWVVSRRGGTGGGGETGAGAWDAAADPWGQASTLECLFLAFSMRSNSKIISFFRVV